MIGLMHTAKKIFTLCFFTFLIFGANNVLAQDNLNLYFFWGDGCPHCAKEEEYLEILKAEYPSIKIYDFEVYNNADNIRLLQKIGQEMGMEVSGVPFSIIGDKQFVGFTESSTPKALKSRVEYCLANGCTDNAGVIAGVVGGKTDPKQEESAEKNTVNEIILPIIGKINPANFSLPILTIIIGGLDGFNPCATWTLLFLMSLLLGMQDRKRMWLLGTAFIVASALVYFVFMAAWLNLILFLGFIIWVRIGIGVVALAGGSYNVRDFFVNKNAVCKVEGSEKKQKVFDKLKDITQMQSFWLALGGIVALAFAVNLVELICSAGLPAVYTQVLALSGLAQWQYYAYIALYVFVFMLDDLFIFFVGMLTLQMSGITTKYARASKLIGGMLMLAIGLMLIFKPAWLMFG